MADMRVSTGYLRRLQREANNELDRRYFAAVAAEIERLRTENDRWRDAAWHARRNEDVLQALIDAYAVAWHSRGIFDAAGERRMIEARNALLAVATQEQDDRA